MVDKLHTENKRRILAIVGAIPCHNNVYAGIFTINQLIELTKTNNYIIDVIFPRPMFPKLMNWIGRRIKKTIFVLNKPIDLSKEDIDVHLIPYLHLPKLSTFMMILTAYFYILLKKVRFDIIHAYFLFFPGYLGIKLGNLFNKPVVVTAMGSDINMLVDKSIHGKNVKPHIIKKITLTLKKADLIVAKSDYLKERVMEFGVSKDKVKVINNGVSEEQFHLLDKQGEALNEKKKIVLYVGNLLVEKGVVELIEAVEILSRKRDDFSLKLIGNGPFKKELSKLIEKLRLVKFVGLEGEKEHEEIPQWIHKSHVVCLPSYHEGFPNIVVESISCGRPVVASNIGGIPEIINDKELGILIPPRDPEKLAWALEEALDKEWNREEIAGSAARFYWDTILPKFEELYNELI